MKIYNIATLALSELFNQKRKMFLILTMLTISLIMMYNQFAAITQAYLVILETKAILTEDETLTYKLDMSSYVICPSEDVVDKIISFFEDVNHLNGVRVCGSFLYYDDPTEGLLLYMSNGLESLCGLKYCDGSVFDWGNKSLASNSKWLADSLDGNPVDISNCRLIQMEDLISQYRPSVCESLNNVYLISTSDFELSDLYKSAQKNEITLGSVSTMKDLFANMAVEIKSESGEDSTLIPLLIVLISVLSYTGTMLTYLFSESHNIGILYSIGFYRRDYVKIIFSMNLFLFLTGYIISLAWEYIILLHSGANNISSIMLYSVPIYTIFIFIITCIGTFLPLSLLWKRTPAELIGGYDK